MNLSAAGTPLSSVQAVDGLIGASHSNNGQAITITNNGPGLNTIHFAGANINSSVAADADIQVSAHFERDRVYHDFQIVRGRPGHHGELPGRLGRLKREHDVLSAGDRLTHERAGR